MSEMIFILFEYPNDYEADPMVFGVFRDYHKAKERMDSLGIHPYHHTYGIEEFALE